MIFEEFLRSGIRNNRRSPWARSVAHWAERYLNAWHNTGFYEFDRNGERFVLDVLRRTFPDRALTIWDVGAHTGDYAEAAHDILPDARVISFEILPPIARRLKERGFSDSWFKLLEVGLSDRQGSTTVHWNKRFDTTNSIDRHEGAMFAHTDVEQVECPVATVDSLIAEGVASPDFLKIDVEGHEGAVIAGAAATLASANRPTLIQFEYGSTWIAGSRTLCAVQGLLERAGYAVGRLYPDHVAFKAYDYADERYRMGNMIATCDKRLQAALS